MKDTGCFVTAVPVAVVVAVVADVVMEDTPVVALPLKPRRP